MKKAEIIQEAEIVPEAAPQKPFVCASCLDAGADKCLRLWVDCSPGFSAALPRWAINDMVEDALGG